MPVVVACVMSTVTLSAPTLPVTTADAYGELLEHPEVIRVVDVLGAHVHGYWESVDVRHAVALVHSAFVRLSAVAPGKPVWILESGWPTCGVSRGAAIPSVENARAFLINVLSWSATTGVPVFLFASRDEAWKAAYEDSAGGCWGIWRSDDVLKPGMEDVFKGMRVPDNWSGASPIDGPGIPAVELTFVPPIGSARDLTGRIRHIAPADVRIATYIRVHGGYWGTKPYWGQPVSLEPDGTFVVDVTTGGSDAAAAEIVVVVLPKGVVPPVASGQSTLPVGLDALAIARVAVQRR